MPTFLTSLHNPHVKEVAKLEKRSEREQARLLPVEGVREVSRALAAGHVPVTAFVCPELAVELGDVVAQLEQYERGHRTRLFTVTPEVFARLAMRENGGGVLLLLPYLQTDLNALVLPPAPLLAVVENAEKPGNLGAILRTADAAGVDALLVCSSGGATDLHNPNVVRASLGTLFTVPVAEAPTAKAIPWLRRHNLRIVAASPEGAELYTTVELRGGVALVLGSEAHGLSAPWLEAADARVVIPMYGEADSLNLSASAAILLYEAVRQRRQL